MYALVSLLDERHSAKIRDLWQELQKECGLAGINLTPLPHISWHVSGEYNFKQLDTILPSLARRAQPFPVHTTGLGIFTGLSPVIFIAVVKDTSLAVFHQVIWERVNPVALDTEQSLSPSPHYGPEAWMPHITVAYGDVSAEKLGCAVEKLIYRPFNWEIRIDHLALVYQISGQVGKLQSTYSFGT